MELRLGFVRLFSTPPFLNLSIVIILKTIQWIYYLAVSSLQTAKLFDTLPIAVS